MQAHGVGICIFVSVCLSSCIALIVTLPTKTWIHDGIISIYTEGDGSLTTTAVRFCDDLRSRVLQETKNVLVYAPFLLPPKATVTGFRVVAEQVVTDPGAIEVVCHLPLAYNTR